MTCERASQPLSSNLDPQPTVEALDLRAPLQQASSCGRAYQQACAGGEQGLMSLEFRIAESEKLGNLDLPNLCETVRSDAMTLFFNTTLLNMSSSPGISGAVFNAQSKAPTM